MCGIVGLFIKAPKLEKKLGALLSSMLVEMTERGPDSTGIAIYGNPAVEGRGKVTVLSIDPDYSWDKLGTELKAAFGDTAEMELNSNHAILTAAVAAKTLQAWLRHLHPELYMTSSGKNIVIYKEQGLPKEVIERFRVGDMSGTHALGHTRMATESAVTTSASHPFSTGEDLCLVHNGSLSNHNRLRDFLQKEGVEFQTDNDSEVAAGYLTWKLQNGANLDEALEAGFEDLDGFYTFAIGTYDGFAVIKDPIGAKPAILAETNDWVAMASEFRSIACLPGVEDATIWEPEPARIYSWRRH